MKTNILIFPAGEINSVELLDSLSYNVNLKVFGASSIDRHGPYVFENYYGNLPKIDDDNFIKSFNEVITKWSISYIFPTHDTVALFLAKNRNSIKAEVIVSDYETALICRDKKKTYEFFKNDDFCPIIYDDLKTFPVYVKPRDSQGGKGNILLKRKEDIPSSFSFDNKIIVEYLPGDELTVDCLTDKNGKLRACLPRTRDRTMAGVCVSGKSIKATKEIEEIANIINNRIKLFGIWFFQLKKDINGKYKLLEISTRCPGTLCLSRARGINLPLLSVYSAMGKEIEVSENSYNVVMDRTLITRYKIDYEFDKVYVDYDDTVITNGMVCIPVISFLYQCQNKGKSIILLTRHDEDHDDTIEDNIKKYNISPKLFNKIIKLSFNKKKCEYIDKEKSIFIDNSFSERNEVRKKHNIPVFDVEGIEVLFDWRK